MGRVHKFGDNIDTDVIVPGKYLNTSNPDELAKICMEGYQENYAACIQKGDFFVCGHNFGCGSSRQHAPVAIKGAGVTCLIGKSFARIFYRNAINLGLPVLECPEIVDITCEGDDLELSLEEGIITNLTKQKTFKFIPYPDSIMQIIQAGGLNRNYFELRRKGK